MSRATLGREVTLQQLLWRGSALLVCGTVVFASMFEAYFAYLQATRSKQEELSAEASWAGTLVALQQRQIAAALRQVASRPWGGAEYDQARMSVELGRLQRDFTELSTLAFFRDGQLLRAMELNVAIDAQDPALKVSIDIAQRLEASIVSACQGVVADINGGFSYHCTFRTTQPRLTLISRISTRGLSEALSRINVARDTSIAVIDGKGIALAHSIPVFSGRQIIDADIALPDRWSGWAMSHGGVSVLRAIERIPETSWYAVAEAPQAVALAAIPGIAFRTLATLTLAIAAAFFASTFLARRQARPAAALAVVVDAFSKGDLAARAQPAGGMEFRRLAGGFNQMATRIQDDYATLEMRVAEKTEALADANEQLVKASRHKSEFLAHMSHELRTPLNAVIGFSDLLKAEYFGLLNQKQSEYVRDINASGQHLLSLINDILDLAKVEAGRMELMLSDAHVAALVESCVALVSERVTRSQQTLMTDVAPDVSMWPLDVRKVKQCLLNLLTNASKFTPAGGAITLRVWVENNELVAAVSDNGVGIAADDLSKLFSEFYQAKAADDASGVAAQREGTGLGLALTKGFVELHGGTISVDSVVGKGSTFTIRFPALAVGGADDTTLTLAENVGAVK